MAAAKKEPRSDTWLIVGIVVAAVAITLVLVLVVVPSMTGDTEETAGPDEPTEPAALYERHCGTCHGLEGQGNLGPALGGGAVVAAYPDVEDQIAVIEDGRNAMPPFGDVLTDEQILAITEYTRTELGTSTTTSTTTAGG